MADHGYMSIGEVLALLKPEFDDLTISKIRFLESQGLLDPERTPSGYRKFYGPDVERLRWILRQQHENYLPLKVIKGKLVTDPESGEVTDDGQEVSTASHPSAAPDGPRRAGAANLAASGVSSRMSSGGSSHASSGALSRVSSAVDNGRAVQRRIGAPSFDAPPSGVSVTMDELAVNSGLSLEDLAELVRFSLITGKTVGGTTYYDEEAVSVAQLAAGFMRYGVEARHLRMYRTSAEREASFFEQIVMPMLKQRNPQARRQAVDALVDLSALGEGLRASMLRQALRDYTNP